MSKLKRKLSLYPIAYTALTLAILALSVLILQRLAVLPLFPFQVEPTPTPVKVTLNYNSPEYKFSVRYPQYWVDNRELGAIITFVSPMYEHPDKRFHSTNISITATEIPADHPEIKLDEFVLESEKRLIENAADYKRVSLGYKTVSGLPAAFIEWTWTVNVPVLKETPATPSPESPTPGSIETPTPTPAPSPTPSPSLSPTPSPTPTPEYEIKADPMISRQAVFIKDKQVFVISYTSLREVDATYKDSFDVVTSTFKFQQD